LQRGISIVAYLKKNNHLLISQSGASRLRETGIDEDSITGKL
jgi:hypothetical protein